MSAATGIAPALVGGNGTVAALRTEGLCVHFRGVRALDQVSLRLDRGEILGLIGPNGAGKSTLVNAVSGFQVATSGTVHLGEVDITAEAAHQRTARGLARTFQSVRLFTRMSVRDNVEIAALGAGAARHDARARSRELIGMLELGHRIDSSSETLSHGEERRLSIARALATRPEFLLLDEPAAGLNEVESQRLTETLATLPADFDLGLMVIEHDMGLIMQLCHRIHVLDHGTTLAVGTPAEVRANPRVLEAYLGTGKDGSHAAG